MPKPSRTVPAQPPPATALEDLLQHLKIDHWDYLLIGDGSATTWERACGFASVLVERETLRGEVLDGSFLYGTNYVAEIMAVLYPLLYLMEREDRRRDPHGATQVHVVTDNQNVQQVGSGQRQSRSHALLWSQLLFLRSCGIITHFHWIDRSRCRIQRLAHHACNQARIQSEQGRLARQAETLKRARIPNVAALLDPDMLVT
jgi:ribonuclease HI